MNYTPMTSWIQQRRGTVLRQAITGYDALDGLHEDMLTRQGFAGRDTQLYRRHEPTKWTRVEGNTNHVDIDGARLEPTDLADPAGGPMRLFHNDAVSIWVSRRSADMPFSVRNADGDEIYFVHRGTGTFYTEFGPLPYEPGDWVLVPKGVTYRIRPETSDNYLLLIESTEELGLADAGPIGRRAPFDTDLFVVPTPQLDELGDGRNDAGEYPLRLKFRNEYTSIFYDFDPIDVEGWKGDLFPMKMNIRDYRPVMSDRIHIMPSAYGIFASPSSLVGNMVQRPYETAPDAEPVPPYHRNMDYDEFIFVHGGTAMGLPVAPASISLTPQGMHHGLPADVAEKARETIRGGGGSVDMQYIIVDTKGQLHVDPGALRFKRDGDQIREGVTAK
ncbi:homogentisate 1,2-dioxygenase [Amycolatopsis sp. CA-161197]|uniref:homogentisate 1,2-dioxygenase n=1 Tax=unclassified Amycolatopsis TaxID=2618356 RepID=UPI0036A047C1